MDKVQVLAPAGNLTSLKAAVDNGADEVYVGFSDSTNARNYEGLNFTDEDMQEGINYAHKKGAKVFVAINTNPQQDHFDEWKGSVDKGLKMGADALIVADIALLKYTRDTYPDAEIHLSVQASSSNYESVNFFAKKFGVKRVVMPRVITIADIAKINDKTDVEIEAFALGGNCINMEGRCALTSFVTGSSPNTEGACSPSRFVDFSNDASGTLTISLNDTVLNKIPKDEPAPYPTSCKGRFVMPDGSLSYAMEDPESLNVLSILPDMIKAGVKCLKIEGRQRTKTYVAAMTKVLRRAVDSYYENPEGYEVKQEWLNDVLFAFEGTNQTTGCYIEQ